MSHVVMIDLEIRDLDALAAAASKLGLDLVRGQTRYRWYGRSVGGSPLPEGFQASDLGKCEHAIRVQGSSPQTYEIGVVRRRDGRQGYTLLWDFWNGGYGLQEKVGENADKLKQAYATEVSRRYWVRKGYRVTETRKEDGTVLLKAVR
jgi:hypothetical protein